MKITHIKNRSTLFTYDLGEWDLNLHLIRGEKNNYIIDTGLGTESVKPILDYIKEDRKPIIVINTHYHWDHVWGNCEFQNNIIISHEKCRQTIAEKWDYMMNRNSILIHGEAVQCLPNLVFDKELYFPEDRIRLFYTPGHTRDSISVLDEVEGVLNAGDNIGDNMEEIIPSLDCDHEQYMDTLFLYSGLSFDTCISGHNHVLGKDIIGVMINLVKE